MKHILLLFSIITFPSHSTYAEEYEDDSIQEGKQLIDTLFEHVRDAVKSHQCVMTEEWLSTQQKEIKELQNILSDARIFSFDTQTKNHIPSVLSSHVIQKTNDHISDLFDVDGIGVKHIKDFYEFSRTLCKLSGGMHCARKVRAIENDHFDKMLLLKMQKAARKQLRKETAQQLRDALLFGMRDKNK